MVSLFLMLLFICTKLAVLFISLSHEHIYLLCIYQVGIFDLSVQSAPQSTCYAAIFVSYVTLRELFSWTSFFSPRSPQSHSSLGLWAYPDVDWARDPTDNRSITTYYFLEWTSLISWYSKKLFIVARSSIEFKYKVLTYTISSFVIVTLAFGKYGCP